MTEQAERIITATTQGMQWIHAVRRLDNRLRAIQMERVRLANRATASKGRENLRVESTRIEQEHLSLQQKQREQVEALVGVLEGIEKELTDFRGEVETVLSQQGVGGLQEKGRQP